MTKRDKVKYCKKCKYFYLPKYGHTCKDEEKTNGNA